MSTLKYGKDHKEYRPVVSNKRREVKKNNIIVITDAAGEKSTIA